MTELVLEALVQLIPTRWIVAFFLGFGMFALLASNQSGATAMTGAIVTFIGTLTLARCLSSSTA